MKGRRFLSLLLCLVMVLGMLPGLAIPASAADTTYTKYNLHISACTSDDGSTRKDKVDNAIDFSKSTISGWYLKRGKTPTKYTDQSLGIADAVSSLTNNLIFETGEDNYNSVTFKIYLKDGYQFSSATKALAYTDVNYTTQVKRWSCSSSATAADGSRTYTYTASSKRWATDSTLYLCIPVEQTGAAKKTLTLYPIMGKKATTVTVTEGETLPDLSSELLKYDEEYFSLADVDSWYTACLLYTSPSPRD